MDIDCSIGDGYITVIEDNIRIQSPNHPGNYPSPLDCQASIRYAPYHLVEITIEDFKIKQNLGCSDFLVFRDSGNTNAGPNTYLTYKNPTTNNVFESFCGTSASHQTYLPPGTKMTATSNLMELTFYSVLGQPTNSGFKLLVNAGKNSTITY